MNTFRECDASKQARQSGFTLIELLVVIAIIGLLASVILAALGLARGKASDGAIKGDMHGVAPQMELFANANGGSYNGGCNASATSSPPGAYTSLIGALSVASTQLSGLVYQNDHAGAYNAVTCNDSNGNWAAEAPLSASKSGSPVMWCVDSTGQSKQEATNLATGATYTCS